MNNRAHRRQRRKGFTLVEVMLVVGILALLAMFVVPSMIGAQDKAKIKAATAMVGASGTIGGAIELFHLEYGKFPDELVDLIEAPDYLDDDQQDAYKPFLKSNQKFEDPWLNELVYTYPGDVNEDGYDLVSYGPDGEEGTEDDITNYPKED